MRHTPAGRKRPPIRISAVPGDQGHDLWLAIPAHRRSLIRLTIDGRPAPAGSWRLADEFCRVIEFGSTSPGTPPTQTLHGEVEITLPGPENAP